MSKKLSDDQVRSDLFYRPVDQAVQEADDAQDLQYILRMALTLYLEQRQGKQYEPFQVFAETIGAVEAAKLEIYNYWQPFIRTGPPR